MAWWAWLVLGFFLLIGELVTPGGFYLLFFGISALIVGLLAIFGISEPAWLQWLMFSIISVASLALFRKPLVRKFSAQGAPSGSPTVDTDSLVGEVAVTTELIAAGGVGRVEMRGSAWKACNRGTDALTSGQRCIVERVEGLMLEVRAQ